MDLFYIIVGSTAIIILILVLLYVGLQMVTNKTASGSNLFPPTYSTCPDYWSVSNGKCVIPTNGNARNIGSLSSANYSNIPGYDSGSGSINFSDAGWSAAGSAICAQQTWANSNGITWDGVTNYNGC